MHACDDVLHVHACGDVLQRSITAALADPAHKDIPLAPWDLTSRMEQHFAGKLSPIELDEVKLTSEWSLTNSRMSIKRTQSALVNAPSMAAN